MEQSKINISPATLEEMKRFFAATSIPRIIKKRLADGTIGEIVRGAIDLKEPSSNK